MSLIDFQTALKTAITAGETVVVGNTVKIIADNGAEVANATLKVVQGGNGVASETYAMTTASSGGSATTTGLGILSVDLGVFGAALAPCLGVAAGVGIYHLTPNTWDKLFYELKNAGRTINGKVFAFFDGDNIYFDEETIEIFKNVLCDAGLFELNLPDYLDTGIVTVTSHLSGAQMMGWLCSQVNSFSWRGNTMGEFANALAQYPTYIPFGAVRTSNRASEGWSPLTIYLYPPTETLDLDSSGTCVVVQTYGYQDEGSTNIDIDRVDVSTGLPPRHFWIGIANDISRRWISGVNGVNSPDLQPDATYPDPDEEFPLRYPKWYPYEYPQTVPQPSELPKVYPVKYPNTEPDPKPKQDPAQNPDPESVPDTYPYIIPDLPLPNPNPNPNPNPDPAPQPEPDPVPTPTPTPTPTPDPDPQPDPDPIPDPDPYPDPTPDPVDPNPDPTPTPTPPVIPLPDTVSSNKLFTVYNPSSAQLDALGGYLWDSNIIEIISKMWQNPLDGIISLIQVYATPTVGGSSNIILGYLDSGVSAPVVSNQFVTVDCGEVTVKEKKKNATDYSPYTSMYIYLPFIGITEIDINDFMNGKVGVQYKIDVYTGACIATVTAKRNKDTPNGARVYEFSGNCAQQIPLTSGNATGMISALISGAGAGLAIATGGGLGVVAGASMIGRSLTHEMFHVSHSGNLSANAGILGSRTPYLIITRRQNYDANSYNNFYGYPSNKTVILGNCVGHTVVKECHLKTWATKPEHDEIISLLQSGIIL